MMKRVIIIVGIGLAVLLYLGVKHVSQPRGIRNNNPGNIKHGVNWNGRAAIQTDPTFITFDSPEYGIRAMARTLRTYREEHGLKTIIEIINRWAPPSDDNPTDDYVTFVSDQLGVSAYVELDFTDETVAKLVEAITQFENGQQPYERATVLAGIELERAA